MIAVGVAKLKASLSAYLAKVKAGQEIVVTEHGRPIARLVPVVLVDVDGAAHLAHLERSGLLTRGSGGIAEAVASLLRMDDPDGAWLAALLAEREENR